MADKRPVNDIYAAICRLLEKHTPGSLPASEIPIDLSFFDPVLEFGSVELVEFILDCEATFGFPFPSHLMENPLFSIADLAEFVAAKPVAKKNRSDKGG